jgi:hypothetical protein
MVDQASAVAEVEVVSAPSGANVLHIKKWLKNITIKAEKGTYAEDTSTVLISGSAQDLSLLSSGKSYIVFMSVPIPDYEDLDMCKRFTGTMALSVGAQGIFEMAGDLIGKAGLAQYSGQPVSLLEQDILSTLPTEPLPVTHEPDTGPDDLVRLAQSADMIAEVHLVGADAAVGTYFENLEVLKWLKKPASFSGTSIDMRFGRCSDVFMGGFGQHYIIFINRITDQYSDGLTLVNRTDISLVGGNQGFYQLSDDNRYITSAGLRYYYGWGVQSFEDEIQKALLIPGTPDPKLRPPDTGTPQP